MGDEAELVARLQAGDEAAFVALVDGYHAPLLRLASAFVPARVAEEVVQEAWLGVVRGIDRFEGRSSLKTWLARIVVNRARSTWARERRIVPSDIGDEPAVPPSRFDEHGSWVDPPAAWVDDADERLAAEETAERIRAAIDELPEHQRQVVLLRDVEGFSAREVCQLLDISEVNQRVLLHRGRSRVRGSLELELGRA